MTHPGAPRVTTEVLQEPSPEAVAALSALLPQVSTSAPPLTETQLSAALEAGTRIVLARLDGVIVGMALLAVVTTMAGRFGLVEEVAVDEAARGNQLSTLLMRAIMQLAAELRLSHLELTSRPSRDVANHLYRSLGFVKRDTNCYRYDIPVT